MPPDPHDIEALLRTLVSSSDDPVGVSRGIEIRVVNPALLAMFGYEREEDLIGGSFLDLMSERSRERLTMHVRARTDGRAPGSYRATAVRRDGTPFPVDIRTTTLHHDGVVWSLAILREVSGDPATELYEAVFTQNTAMKLLIDPDDGSIVDANESAVKFYGWSKAELRAKRIQDINTLPATEVEARMRAAERSEIRFFEFQHRVADGSVRDVQVHSGPVQVGGRTLLLSICHDVSERVSLQAQLQEARRLEAVGRLAGGVAHDFNNLLTIVTACAERIGELTRDEADVQQQVRDLLTATDRATGVVRQLLAAGRRQTQVLGPVNLDRVVQESIPLLRRVAGPGVALDVNLEPVVVSADPAHLSQVLLNLVVNASEALTGQGIVHLTVHPEPPWGVLEVRDEGPGMSEDVRARVFEPFFTTKSEEGTPRGLGLASVYGIVSQTGGAIEVESAPGHGARFVVRLPVHSKPLPATARVETARRVLLVEDDAQLRALLTEGLTRAGFEVRAEATGEPALALPDADLRTFDFLVSDHLMPGPSGTDVAIALVARHPALRVVLISGHLPPAERRRLPPGASFLPKPFALSKLFETLASAGAPGSPARPES